MEPRLFRIGWQRVRRLIVKHLVGERGEVAFPVTVVDIRYRDSIRSVDNNPVNFFAAKAWLNHKSLTSE
jgi:hypothetical protein